MAKDYYEILGVGKNATDDEIKRGYRRLAQKHHPDKAGGDEAKFKEINEAYQVLSDKAKRSQYDQFGTTFEQAQGQGGFSGFNGFRDFSGFAEAFSGGGGASFGADFGDLGDIFSEIFGGRTRTSSRVKRGKDISMQVEISLEEAARGVEKELEIYKSVACPKCNGQGNEPGSKIEICQTCGGSGSVFSTRRAGFFTFSQTEICPSCKRAGKRPSVPCSQCRGSGRINERVKIRVKIPAGIESGQIIKLSGQGEAAPLGGQAGDLYLAVSIRRHSDFVRKGANLYYDLFIHIAQAALGDKIEIPTLEGSVKLKIPAGIDAGEVIRLKGKGMPRFNSRGKGDFMVTVHVKTPKKLSRKARRLLEELGREL